MSLLAWLVSFALLEPPAVEPVSLRWQSECVEREQALVRLRELIPELPEQVPEQAGQVAVEVEIEGTSAEVRFVSARGLDERTLEGQSCESLAKAVILVIAVAVEAEVGEATAVEAPVVETEPIPESVPEPKPSEPEPSEPEPSEPEPDESPSTSIEPTPPREPTPAREKQRIRGHVGLLGGGGWGPIDAGMGALVLEVGAQGRRWRASARGIWVPPRTIALADDPRLLGRYDGGFAGARACLLSTLARERIELPMCTGVEAGVLHGRGVGTTPAPDEATQPWVGAQLGPGLRYVPNRWIALGVEVDLVVSLLRGGFTLGDAVAQVHAPIGVRALAGIELRFL